MNINTLAAENIFFVWWFIIRKLK